MHRFDITGPARRRYVASGRCRAGCSTSTRCPSTGPPAGRDHLAGARARAAAGPRARSPCSSAATLVQVGEVGGLGVGERIYAVRFLGPVGYVVTFRQTDPLYTVDLRTRRGRGSSAS